jgi:hypothetical protein
LNQSGRGRVTVTVENVTNTLDTNTLKVKLTQVDDYIARDKKELSQTTHYMDSTYLRDNKVQNSIT